MKRALLLILVAASCAIAARAATLAEWNFDNAAIGATTNFAPSAADSAVTVTNLVEIIANGDADAPKTAPNKTGVLASPRAAAKNSGSLAPEGQFLEVNFASTAPISKTAKTAPAHGYFLEFTITAKKGKLSLNDLDFNYGVDLGKSTKSAPALRVYVSDDDGKTWKNITPSGAINESYYKGYFMKAGEIEDKSHMIVPASYALSKTVKNVPAGQTVRIALALGDGSNSDAKGHILDSIKLTGTAK